MATMDYKEIEKQRYKQLYKELAEELADKPKCLANLVEQLTKEAKKQGVDMSLEDVDPNDENYQKMVQAQAKNGHFSIFGVILGGKKLTVCGKSFIILLGKPTCVDICPSCFDIIVDPRVKILPSGSINGFVRQLAQLQAFMNL